MLGRFRCVQILETECGEIFIDFHLPTRMILDTLIFLTSKYFSTGIYRVEHHEYM